MSHREARWYCHQCETETRPLMMPDPHCETCHGTFVEKLENLDDDPREFRHHLHRYPMPGSYEDGEFPIEALLTGLHISRSFPGEDRPYRPSNRRLGGSSTGSGFRLVVASNGSPGGILRDTPPFMMSGAGLPDMLDRGPEARGIDLTELMMHYFMSRAGDSMHPFPMRDADTHGDYVYTQEGLDRLMTLLMEQGSSTRPVPANESIISALPREVLKPGSATLGKDCAVCKDQFKLGTEDPEEQIVTILPCAHVFHQQCIVPWLNSSGTCPVCRHALVQQPGQPSPAPAPGTSRHNVSPPRDQGSSSGDRPAGTSLLGSIFGRSSSSRHNEGRRSRRHEESRTPNRYHEESRTPSRYHEEPRTPSRYNEESRTPSRYHEESRTQSRYHEEPELHEYRYEPHDEPRSRYDEISRYHRSDGSGHYYGVDTSRSRLGHEPRSPLTHDAMYQHNSDSRSRHSNTIPRPQPHRHSSHSHHYRPSRSRSGNHDPPVPGNWSEDVD